MSEILHGTIKVLIDSVQVDYINQVVIQGNISLSLFRSSTVQSGLNSMKFMDYIQGVYKVSWTDSSKCVNFVKSMKSS